ncbi:SMI1/KNR4 family protein [Pedobacter jejuensis]|uniref:SMI1/KNR4 family protein n=1 Tax=Pedobacter jejuensis TaxID=1268550 RepID=A0A3N0BLL8_9SPHI|nr:SMI1/KNR4 family protein [Pedobacter jejuensis]RNL49649.1 SMI1/KNR4 family protein [Pedobacter jejuensis]
MKKILKKISETAIRQGVFTFTDDQKKSKWLGNEPATKDEIKQAEDRLGLELPADYKAFLSIANGFASPNEHVEPSFVKVNEIGFLKDIDPKIIEDWLVHDESFDIVVQLSRSILVGGINEEQYFLLIPPIIENTDWKYWKFATWIPGEDDYEGLENYFINVLDFLAPES